MTKRTIPFMLCVFLLFSLSACMQPAEGTDPADTTGSSASSLPIETVPIEGCISYPTFTQAEYQEYLEYINTEPLPENFMSYERLAALGNFGIFVHTPGTSDYTYMLIDDNGYTAYLSVIHRPLELDFTESQRIELSLEGITDLSHHPSETRGYLFINNCAYLYSIDGGIYAIKWESNGISFSLSEIEVPDNDSATPVDSLFRRLLSIDTAYEATQELLEIADNSSATE